MRPFLCLFAGLSLAALIVCAAERAAAPAPAAVPVSAVQAHKALQAEIREVIWPELQRKAAAGDVEALWRCGMATMAGTFGPADFPAGFRMFEQAAKQRHGKSLNTLGEIHALGEQVPKDLPKAIRFFEAAWAAGEPAGMFNMGVLAEHGQGRGRDTVEAVHCYRLAADKGSSAALVRLGLMSMEGDVVPQDSRKALEYWRQAAETGSAEAAMNLAIAYYQGEDVPADKAKALAYAQQAFSGSQSEAGYLAAKLLVELKGDYPQAMAYMLLYRRFDDSAEAQERGRRFMESLEGKFDYQKANERIGELVAELELAGLRRSSREGFGR